MAADSDEVEWTDVNGSALCHYLDWDSNFFEFRIARVETDVLSPDKIEEIMAWCWQHEIDCLYFLASSSDAVSTRLAEDNGFHWVDVRVTLDRMIIDSAPEASSNSSILIRSAHADDLPSLRSIAREGFHETRFYFDPHFPRHLCDSLYETWIEVSFSGYADAVLVADVDAEPAGFITCKLGNPLEGEIGLVGVGSGWQSRGIGVALVKAALNWFADHHVERATVVTQGRNIPAQRLYQRCGFLTRSAQLWYHWWYEDR
jgi:dTDP-4-amino-4,6-dideoxy-D-galactose acyltransferase